MKFLASKKMSLFCFAINCLFAGAAWLNRDALWFTISTAFAVLCYYNYQNTEE